MNPSFRKLFMKNFTRKRVVRTISASESRNSCTSKASGSAAAAGLFAAVTDHRITRTIRVD
jgi:hypothetical protein